MAARKCLSVRCWPGADPGEALVALIDGAAAFAEEAGLSTGAAQRLAIVIEELASNAARHGAGGEGLRVSLELTDEGDGVAIVFEDDGVPFDPTTRPVFQGPDPITGGGVGIELVRAWCEGMVYQRVKSNNRLRLKLPRQRK
jgi:anti-sigma regulatory factor (Ser/Thr protein kinase)